MAWGGVGTVTGSKNVVDIMTEESWGDCVGYFKV
jgi:hypothetical protein